MRKPKYKIGDSVVIEVSSFVYSLVQITGAYINDDITSAENEWNYFTSNERIGAVKESDIIIFLNTNF